MLLVGRLIGANKGGTRILKSSISIAPQNDKNLVFVCQPFFLYFSLLNMSISSVNL